jgi:hypothetical protein
MYRVIRVLYPRTELSRVGAPTALYMISHHAKLLVKIDPTISGDSFLLSRVRVRHPRRRNLFKCPQPPVIFLVALPSMVGFCAGAKITVSNVSPRPHRGFV